MDDDGNDDDANQDDGDAGDHDRASGGEDVIMVAKIVMRAVVMGMITAVMMVMTVTKKLMM